jgi:hypothetical protein
MGLRGRGSSFKMAMRHDDDAFSDEAAASFGQSKGNDPYRIARGGHFTRLLLWSENRNSNRRERIFESTLSIDAAISV